LDFLLREDEVSATVVNVSRAILKWFKEADIATAYIDPGKLWQNGTDESFSGKLRDECLRAEWLRTRLEARTVIEDLRRHCRVDRPHSILGYLRPLDFKWRSEGPTAVADAQTAIGKCSDFCVLGRLNNRS
jgi:transposase InsO family protein